MQVWQLVVCVNVLNLTKREILLWDFWALFLHCKKHVKSSGAVKPESKEVPLNAEADQFHRKNTGRESGLVEFVSPEGEVFICNADTDLELGSCHQQDLLIELGCSCKNDLALVHYACALKWFVNHGSTICEVCGHVAINIRTSDFKKVMVALRDYEALRERTATGDPNPAQVHASAGVDPDAVAAVRRQRLSEISLWFSPHNNNNSSAAISQVVSEQPLNTVTEDVVPSENRATKWAAEGTGILLATGLLTVTLAWLIAPRVGKVWRVQPNWSKLRYVGMELFCYFSRLQFQLNIYCYWVILCATVSTNKKISCVYANTMPTWQVIK
ncbi:RING/FYVE/PHD ZINC FINGER SUPERFAMILY PROTEIN [Salix koriyanagi]|uniref:RING/FYVE/PHD ZINC FINGER SUPERFAMILY PROTEIN n=1 Tax=Salix koriyanagi TaxID=2511006 RepID=A0A9Q0SMP4_9ROSI|nr:RING/FYVE/PHD ZINC FINGER SUPERFAMILY PROTEIN [Salix koriyanagi]